MNYIEWDKCIHKPKHKPKNFLKCHKIFKVANTSSFINMTILY